jgi:hypothetical protein
MVWKTEASREEIALISRPEDKATERRNRWLNAKLAVERVNGKKKSFGGGKGQQDACILYLRLQLCTLVMETLNFSSHK